MSCYTVLFVNRFGGRLPLLAVRCRASNASEALAKAVRKVCKAYRFDGWHTDNVDFQFGDFYRNVDNAVSFDISSCGRHYTIRRGYINDIYGAKYVV